MLLLCCIRVNAAFHVSRFVQKVVTIVSGSVSLQRESSEALPLPHGLRSFHCEAYSRGISAMLMLSARARGQLLRPFASVARAASSAQAACAVVPADLQACEEDVVGAAEREQLRPPAARDHQREKVGNSDRSLRADECAVYAAWPLGKPPHGRCERRRLHL